MDLLRQIPGKEVEWNLWPFLWQVFHPGAISLGRRGCWNVKGQTKDGCWWFFSVASEDSEGAHSFWEATISEETWIVHQQHFFTLSRKDLVAGFLGNKCVFFFFFPWCVLPLAGQEDLGQQGTGTFWVSVPRISLSGALIKIFKRI